MISRKKRLRYKSSAARIAKENNIKINLNSWEEIWNLLDRYDEPEYLYVIGDFYSMNVKIGKSVNPGYRLKTLQTAYPGKLILQAFCLHKSPHTEKEIHRRLKKSKVSGEWYSLTPEVTKVISEMREQKVDLFY